MASSRWAVNLLVLLMLATASTMASARHRQHMSVNILNDVGDKPIYLRCQSRDDDLGVQTLVPGQWWGFGFEANVLGTTLFSCNFVYGVHTQGIIAFQDIGFWGNKPRPCRQCVWVVKQDGFYRSEGQAGPFTKVVNWN